MIDLTGRTVLVAGSSRGIGAATARLAARLGARVIVHGRTQTDQLVELGRELEAETIACDGTNSDAVHEVVNGLVARGLVPDSLICTLGAVAATPPLEPDESAWLGMFHLNVLAPVNFVQAVAPHLLARGGGSIALVSSIRGRDNLSSPETLAYGAAKAAVENVTAGFAKELAPTVRVNAVAPGFSLTDMSATWSPEVQRQVDTALLGRAARPEEIARSLVFLISDAASFITGQVLLADGGFELAH